MRKAIEWKPRIHYTFWSPSNPKYHLGVGPEWTFVSAVFSKIKNFDSEIFAVDLQEEKLAWRNSLEQRVSMLTG